MIAPPLLQRHSVICRRLYMDCYMGRSVEGSLSDLTPLCGQLLVVLC